MQHLNQLKNFIRFSKKSWLTIFCIVNDILDPQQFTITRKMFNRYRNTLPNSKLLQAFYLQKKNIIPSTTLWYNFNYQLQCAYDYDNLHQQQNFLFAHSLLMEKRNVMFNRCCNPRDSGIRQTCENGSEEQICNKKIERFMSRKSL